MATNGPQTQAILDIKRFIDDNLESYVQVHDAALTAPESKLGERNAFGAQRYPMVMFDPGMVTNSYSGNYGYESDIEVYIGIVITNSDPAALITALWHYIDAMTELMMSDPTLGGVCIDSVLEDAAPMYGDPQAKNVGAVTFTLRGVIEVQT